MPNRVYFDSSSTTAVSPEVLDTYTALLNKYYVNSESLYREGTEISKMMEKARGAIAALFTVSANEVIFTSGSSESNTAAVKGVCFGCPGRKHIITTNAEHSSIMNVCRQMEEVFGYEVTYLPVDGSGRITPEQVREALRPDTALVTVMHVNNEVGSVNPIGEISRIVKLESHAFMHADLTQSVGKTDIPMEYIDLASVSAHKLEGLKGSGILIRRRHVPFVPLICGGEQEYGLRGGTSNAAVNMVFAKTLRLALENGRKSHLHIRQLHERLLAGLKEIDGIEINSPPEGIAGIVNFSYENIPSEVMQNALDQAGFMVSARSTCASRSGNPSYVLKAMGFSDKRAGSCIRISISRHNTAEDIDAFLAALKEVIKKYG